MTTGILAAEPVRRRSRALWTRLAAAELLKLRKRRGLVAAALVLSIGPMLVAHTVLVLMHASDPAEHRSAGGLQNFGDSVYVLSQLLVVVAFLVGVTAGAADHRAGVFRELVVTGRSRLALFAARVPGGLAFLAVPAVSAFAVTAAASVAFAGSADAPDAALLAQTVAWIALGVAANFALALGVASALGSATTSIACLLAWNFAAIPVLRAIEQFGIRDALLPVALEGLRPAVLAASDPAGTSLVVAVLAIGAWSLAALVLGAWRTARRDA
jgi:hypothetical protein